MSSSDITRLLGRRNITTIPADQQKLLDRHGIEGVLPPGRQPSLDDVPSHVQSAVIDAYVERKKRDAGIFRLTATATSSVNGGTSEDVNVTYMTQVAPPSSPRPDTTQHSTPDGTPGHARHSLPSRPPNSSPVSSSPERVVSWPPSDEEEPDPASPPHGPPKSTPHIAGYSPDNEEHMAPPPKPATAMRLAPTFDFPSSGPEETLEVELPLPGAPISTQNRATVPGSSAMTPNIRHAPGMQTPSCAQPSPNLIPATAVPDSSSPKQVAPVQQRPKRMKPVLFSDSPTVPKPQHGAASTSLRHMPSTKACLVIDSSNTTATSSVLDTSPRKSGTPAEGGPSGTMRDVSRDSSSESAGETNGAVKARSAVQEQHFLPPREQQVRSPHVVQSVEHEIAAHSYHAPFEVFSDAYPSYITKYSGSLLSFVKACVCLEHMAKYRWLHHCLWDDFIRAFSAEYQGYVRNTARPLVAGEWYNDRDEAPLYEDRVVQKGNLSFILESYPDVVAEVRNLVGDTDGEAEAEQPISATTRSPALGLGDKRKQATATTLSRAPELGEREVQATVTPRITAMEPDHKGSQGTTPPSKRAREGSTSPESPAAKRRAVSHPMPQTQSTRPVGNPDSPMATDIPRRQEPARRAITPPTVASMASTRDPITKVQGTAPSGSSRGASSSGYLRRLTSATVAPVASTRTPESEPSTQVQGTAPSSSSRRASSSGYLRRLTSTAVASVANTSAPGSDPSTKVQGTAPPPSSSSSRRLSSSGYLKRLPKGRTSLEQDKFREHIRRRASGSIGPKGS